MHTFFIAPTGFGVGLTSISLGLVRALELAGLKVGFYKPIAQPHPGDLGPERSSELIARTHGLTPPKAMELAQVERLLGDGQLDELLEEIVGRYQQVAEDRDVVIVEGMVPTRHASYAARVNAHLARSLDAEVILVSAPEDETVTELADRLEIQAQLFGGPDDPKVLGVILNKVRDDTLGPQLQDNTALLRAKHFRLLGCIPWEEELNAPRTRDVADLLGARVINAGDYDQRRVQKIILCARTVPNTVPLLKPGVLVVTPGDRDDIILAASLAAMNGVPLAGLLLCSDFPPDPRIMELCQGALQGGLPVLSVASGTYGTATDLNRMNREIPVDDRERAEKVTEFIARFLDHDWLRERCGTPRVPHLSPPAFRHQLVKRAQQAGKRIVLPEGAEPRTVQAAAICQARGIARCVLLAKPEDVQAVARALGIVLPEGLEVSTGPGAPALRRAHGDPAPGQGPERTNGRRATGRQCGAGHHDAGPGRGGRPGVRRRAHHRQHHPPGPAADQDRPRLQAGVLGVLHAPAGTGGGLRRLRGEPRPQRRGAGRDRRAERCLRRRLRHRPAGGDDQLLHRRLRHR